MELKVVEIGGWRINTTPTTIIVPSYIIEEGTTMVKRWAGIFSVFCREENWVQARWEVPTLIARVDGVIVEGRLAVYEVEERPAGIGIVTSLNPQFRRRLETLQKEWPPIVVIVSPRRERKGDDELWAPTVQSFPQDLCFSSTSPALLLRAEPEEKEFWPLVPLSISSVRKKGDKKYGEVMGWWKKVHAPDQLPWTEGFVLKPLQGSKTRGLLLWPPPAYGKNPPGKDTRTKILKVLNQSAGMYCQQWIEPLVLKSDKEMFFCLRLFWGFSPSKGWIPMGGCWNARPNLRLHGAEDAIFGPALLEE